MATFRYRVKSGVGEVENTFLNTTIFPRDFISHNINFQEVEKIRLDPLGKRLSVITGSYRQLSVFDKVLASIFKDPLSPSEYEVLAMLDGPYEDVYSFAKKQKKKHSNLRCFVSEKEREYMGFLFPVNFAVKQAKGDYILIWMGDHLGLALNMTLLLKDISHDTDAYISGVDCTHLNFYYPPELCSVDFEDHLDFKHPDSVDKWCETLNALQPIWDKHIEDIRYNVPLPWGIFTCCLSREWYYTIRGSDEELIGWGGQDVDFWERCMRAGLTWIWDTDIKSVHLHHPYPPPVDTEEKRRKSAHKIWLKVHESEHAGRVIANKGREWGKQDYVEV